MRMSAQRLALSNVLRNGQRLVHLPHNHHASSQTDLDNEQNQTGRLTCAILPNINLFLANTKNPSFHHYFPSKPDSGEVKFDLTTFWANKEIRKVSKSTSVDVSVQTDLSGDDCSSSSSANLDKFTWVLENQIGEHLMQEGYKEEAVERFKNACKNGNVDAMHNYADCLHFGNGVAQNTIKAFKLWKEAAAAEHKDAMYSLALCFLHGNGTSPSKTSALKWFQKAAAKEHVDAAFYMLVHCLRSETLDNCQKYVQICLHDKKYVDEIVSWIKDDCLDHSYLAFLKSELFKSGIIVDC